MDAQYGERELISAEFDPEFYASEYPDLSMSAADLLDHFVHIGWLEGRNPNPFFDVVAYLTNNADVLASFMNPFFHYIWHGRREGRSASPSISPSARTRLLFGYEVTDWVARLEPLTHREFYRNNLPSKMSSSINLAAHFAYRGWRDGLDPNPYHRLSEISARYRRAVTLLVNPLIAMQEENLGNYVSDDALVVVQNSEKDIKVPSELSGQRQDLTEADSLPSKDLDLVRSEFDAEFYLSSNPDVAAAGIDALEHFFYTGWREGRNPTADFDTVYYTAQNPELTSSDLNPFWHYLAIGRSEGRLSKPETENNYNPTATSDQEAQIIASEFSASYYRSQYADITDAEIDPLVHFMQAGWREGRNPNRNFDTGYYLYANEDVREAGLNPFWHYLVAGRKEGRAPVRPGGYRRRLLDSARPPSARTENYVAASGNRLAKSKLRERISKAMKTAKGLVISLSHDCYTGSVGGTQIFIADEASPFNAEGFLYIHLSPKHPKLELIDEDDNDLQIVIDGKLLGAAQLSILRDILKEMQFNDLERYFIVHSLLGFSAQNVLELKQCLSPKASFFWLHDYTSLCVGFNLLRNDLAYCAAPPITSVACRVCCYGAARGKHLERLEALFAAGDFIIVSPSSFTMDLWLQRAKLPHRDVIVHPHWTLKPLGTAQRKAKRKNVRIGFVGYPSANKGWEIFSQIVDRYYADQFYEFYHFATGGTRSLPECRFIKTEVTSSNRWAAKSLLEEHEIDFLAMLSPWPETFSYVAHEGIAAGCHIFCLKGSGNVAAITQRLKVGTVFDDPEELLLAIADKNLLLKLIKRGRKTYSITNSGTSGSLPLIVSYIRTRK